MKEFRSTDEITKEDLEKMYNAIVKFDNYISSVTRIPIDENIGLYEHWIDCRYDIENLIVTDKIDKLNKIKAKLIVEVEAEFYDDESSEETVRYCVEQDLEDAGLNVIDVSVME